MIQSNEILCAGQFKHDPVALWRVAYISDTKTWLSRRAMPIPCAMTLMRRIGRRLEKRDKASVATSQQ